MPRAASAVAVERHQGGTRASPARNPTMRTFVPAKEKNMLGSIETVAIVIAVYAVAFLAHRAEKRVEEEG